MVRHAAPGVDLVGVVRRAAVAALAAGDAGQAVVPIATVGDEAIGRNWPVGFVLGGRAAARADGLEVAAPRKGRHVEEHAQRLADGQRVLEPERMQPTPLPSRDLGAEPSRQKGEGCPKGLPHGGIVR